MKTKRYFQTLVVALAAFAVAGSALASVKNTPAKPTAPIFYPAAPEQPRLQFLKTINGADFFLPANPYGDRFPGWTPPVDPNAKKTDQLNKPYGMAMWNGKLFVCDTTLQAVAIFDLDKKMVTYMGKETVGKLDQPMNIAVAQDGTRYVADLGLNKVMVYNTGNTLINSFGDAKAWRPADLAVNGSKLFVTDLKSNQIVVLDSQTGKELNRFGQAGSQNGDLFKATHLTLDKDGNVLVSDTLNGRISKFSADGKFIRNYGELGDSLGQFARPKGIAVDRENRLYAVDSAFENIQIFNTDGKLLLFFGDVGNIPAGINMPSKVVVDYNNTKYFADSVAPGYAIDYLVLVSSNFGTNMVNVYGFLKKQ